MPVSKKNQSVPSPSPSKMTFTKIMHQLKSIANPVNRAGMARFGINPANTLGISVKTLREIARGIGQDQGLAWELWASGVHEARILASIIEEPGKVAPEQADAWVAELDSWDVCDQCCLNLFGKTHFAYEKAVFWAGQKVEFTRRAGFALMAVLAFHDKHASDSDFEPFFTLIAAGAEDERNFVKKAVNWALRQLGKRNPNLWRRAVGLAGELAASPAKSARWVGKNAVKELQSEAVKKRLGLPQD
ncbi:DNA alkylation repair protein [Chloroflexota bacterium]